MRQAPTVLVLLAIALLPFHHWAPRLVEATLLLAALAAGPAALRDWRCWRRLRPFDGPVAAAVVAGALALAVHPALGDGARTFRLVILEPALLYLLVTRLKPGGERVAYAVIAGAVTASLVGFVQLATGIGPIEAEGVDRIRGPYPSPNNLGLLLDRSVPLAVALGLAGRRWFAAAAVVLLLALALTYSVGAWLACGLGLAIVLWLSGRRRLLLCLAALALAGAVVVLLLRPERVFSPTTTSIRVLLWDSSVQMLADHPVLGVGLDNFLYLYSPDHAERPYMHPDAWREASLSHPHNVVLDWWLSLGLPGLAALAYTLAVFARHARRPRTPLALGLTAAFAATLAHGQIDNSYFLADLAALWWLQLGLLADGARVNS